jgi:geranylgeranyl pyrophosphate synthase
MVSFKTSVLARLSIKLAAIYAGVEDTHTAKLATFAENLGIAFQI